MAFEQYRISRAQNCYQAPLTYRSEDPNPACTLDKYQTFFRKRWDALAVDICKKPPLAEPKSLCGLIDSRGKQTEPIKVDAICLSPFSSWVSETKKDFTFRDHNSVDDCCPAPCNCCDPYKTKKAPLCLKQCKERECLEPLDDMTTHRYYFNKKPTPFPCPKRRTVRPWIPNECPIEGATSYKIDYPHKSCVPNGPVKAATTKHGIWSMGQFSPETLSEATEYKDQYLEKCRTRRPSIPPKKNIISCPGPFARTSETCEQYGPKWAPSPKIPDWVLTEPVWVPPCPPLDDCTTYTHFYPQYCIETPPCESNQVKSPDAIPFSTMNNIWYTCCDPKVDQRIPVELKDNDPWPYAKECPIKYQDNLQPDPCAPFRDDTTQKADYTPKQLCGRRENFAPSNGYTPPLQPFNDNTTNKVAFRAFTQNESKNAKIIPGNPNGKIWGPFNCPPSVDPCLPRFPAPYGNPLKPFTKTCPCGPFDDRSTYAHDFKFRNEEMVQQIEAGMCESVQIPKGTSLYRFDYVDQEGQRAERMPPPESKGHRCIAPSSYRDTDTLYRMQYRDFWQLGSPKMDVYRGKRNDAAARRKEKEAMEAYAADPEPFRIIAMPEGTTVEDVLASCSKEKEKC